MKLDNMSKYDQTVFALSVGQPATRLHSVRSVHMTVLLEKANLRVQSLHNAFVFFKQGEYIASRCSQPLSV